MAIAENSLIAGKYRLESKLGAGTMGEVWCARHEGLGTVVAVKVLRSDRSLLDDMEKRFKREATTTAMLRSRHIVDVRDYGVSGGHAFLVMELLEGEDLDERIQREGPLSPDETVRIVGQIARGLQRAHREGVIHRDLKPANVFLSRQDGEEIAKILDFGIAKALDPGAGDQAAGTAMGVILGSPTYMCPEHIEGRWDKVDHRADLWSLGVIAFRLLTGRLPFEAEHLPDLMAAICMMAAYSPTLFRDDLPPAIDGFFARAFAKDKAYRFDDAIELADALADALGVAATSMGQSNPSLTGSSGPPRSHPGAPAPPSQPHSYPVPSAPPSRSSQPHGYPVPPAPPSQSSQPHSYPVPSAPPSQSSQPHSYPVPSAPPSQSSQPHSYPVPPAPPSQSSQPHSDAASHAYPGSHSDPGPPAPPQPPTPSGPGFAPGGPGASNLESPAATPAAPWDSPLTDDDDPTIPDREEEDATLPDGQAIPPEEQGERTLIFDSKPPWNPPPHGGRDAGTELMHVPAPNNTRDASTELMTLPAAQTRDGPTEMMALPPRPPMPTATGVGDRPIIPPSRRNLEARLAIVVAGLVTVATLVGIAVVMLAR